MHGYHVESHLLKMILELGVLLCLNGVLNIDKLVQGCILQQKHGFYVESLN